MRLRNGAQELTLSTDAVGLVCIGKMSLQGVVVQASGSATADNPGRMGGYSRYRISSSTPIIVAIDLPLGRHVGIISVIQVAAGVWEATCFCGNNPDINGIDANQYQIDVWAFAAATRYGTRGVLLRNLSTHQTAYDLSHPYPLFPRGSGVSTGPAQNIVTVSRPVVMGVPADDFSSHGQGAGANSWVFTQLRGAWTRTAATTLTSGTIVTQRYQYNSTEPRDGSNGDIYSKCSYFILEGAQLP